MEEEDDPFKLVRLGLAKPSNLHPRHQVACRSAWRKGAIRYC
jgi:hypothetical protein